MFGAVPGAGLKVIAMVVAMSACSSPVRTVEVSHPPAAAPVDSSVLSQPRIALVETDLRGRVGAHAMAGATLGFRLPEGTAWRSIEQFYAGALQSPPAGEVSFSRDTAVAPRSQPHWIALWHAQQPAAPSTIGIAFIEKPGPTDAETRPVLLVVIGAAK